MKYYEDSFDFNDVKKHKRDKEREWKREHDGGGFKCSHCRAFVVINGVMGTVNRNHCNICLWSKHVDEAKGDRRSMCRGGMEPVGLTFKREGYNRTGEIMLIHLCSACPKISINRVARDDPEHKILETYEESFTLHNKLRRRLEENTIYLLAKEDKEELQIQLFGVPRV